MSRDGLMLELEKSMGESREPQRLSSRALFGFLSLDTVWLNLLNSACSVEENVVLPTACARVEAINECICRSWVKRKIIGAPAGVLWITEQPGHLLT